ncbi:hypothetical protein DOY81_012872 [Sarcophaga bullata]|nr:hypothetical protein DOY81_012872 [Sarcophaga bullata]
MTDIKEKLEQHEQLLNKIIKNQNDTRQLIKEIDMENHTTENTISDNLVPLQKIDESKDDIEILSGYSKIT